MRKILLATTALVAFAGAAQAAESPIQVTLGGYVDFRAALFHESDKSNQQATDRRDGDFQSEYGVTIAADGKAAGGIEYGAKIGLSNRPAVGSNTATASNSPALKQGYVYLSGAWGKVLLGDDQGATDLFVISPTVGEGQIAGTYSNFTDPTSLVQFQPAYFDATEKETKVTYYTPKVGNANHKVQLGVSYAPNDDRGVVVTKNEGTSYENKIEAVAQYTGTFNPVSVVVTPMIATGDGEGNKVTNSNRDYTMWGVGAQAMYAGFTLGGSYVDAGHFGTAPTGQDKDQNVWTVGLKYEFDKVAVAANYMDGEGYYTVLGASNYVDDFSAVGLGATYTWFPGMSTAADAVFFDQSVEGVADNNIGHVLMLSQKMAF